MHYRSTTGFYTMAFVGLIDQLSKWLILDRMGDVQRTIPVTPFLNLVLVWNKGVTFGFLSRSGQTHYMSYILMSVAAIIVVLLGRWLWRTSSTPVAIALGAIMGGAIGNVIDRLRYGAVADFLDFYYHNYHWYAFNVADAAIVTGVALLLIDGMVRGK
ncbi:MAG: signal peptidase II [Alphaproteobacteria bacterium]|nr:signal peptidase II [Alphaproteobacteria bacterium]